MITRKNLDRFLVNKQTILDIGAKRKFYNLKLTMSAMDKDTLQILFESQAAYDMFDKLRAGKAVADITGCKVIFLTIDQLPKFLKNDMLNKAVPVEDELAVRSFFEIYLFEATELDPDRAIMAKGF